MSCQNDCFFNQKRASHHSMDFNKKSEVKTPPWWNLRENERNHRWSFSCRFLHLPNVWSLIITGDFWQFMWLKPLQGMPSSPWLLHWDLNESKLGRSLLGGRDGLFRTMRLGGYNYNENNKNRGGGEIDTCQTSKVNPPWWCSGP